MVSDKYIVAKADLQVADLITYGGALLPEQAAAFMRDVIKESVMLSLVTVQGLKSYKKYLEAVGIAGRVLHPGTSGVALPYEDRTAATPRRVELDTHLMKGQIDLTDEDLEDNIENGTFKTTVMEMMSEAVAYDMDYLLVNGDTASTDPLLALFDGMIKSATAHVINGGTVALTKQHLKDAVKAMPSEFNRGRAAQRFLMSEDAETDYRDFLSDRATVVGDKFMEDEAPARYSSRPLLGVPAFPDNLGVGANCTNVLLLDPKIAVWGVWRKIVMETERDAKKGIWSLIASIRAGFAYKDARGVVKITNIKTQ